MVSDSVIAVRYCVTISHTLRTTAFVSSCCRLSPADPFVGGGTVVLEAMRAGRVAVGSDISPLALFVSRGRCWMSPDDELERLREVGLALCKAGLSRRSAQHLCSRFKSAVIRLVWAIV